MRDLLDDLEYDDLVDQVKHEAKQFGSVKNMAVPRPEHAELVEFVQDRDVDYSAVTPLDDNNKGLGKVFIEYDSAQEAERAQKEFAGRKFQGRTCITSYHDHQDFINKKY